MATTTEDVEIPKPVASGATDFPDAPQSGTVAPPPLPEGYTRPATSASAPPPLPEGYTRATTRATAPPSLPKGYTRNKPTAATYAGTTGLENPEPTESVLNKGLDAGLAVYNGAKRGYNYAKGDSSSPPQQSTVKSTSTVPGAPPVTFQDKNALEMQPMSYLDPSTAGRATNAGKLQGLPGVDARTPRFREGLGDVMTATAPLMVPAAIAAPGVTAGALVGGGVGAKVGGKVGGTVAEALHEGAGPTGEDIGSTVGMIAGAHRGGIKAEQIGREITPQNEAKTPLKDLTDVQRKATEHVDALEKDRATAKTKLDKAQAKYDQHIASHEQGIESPAPVKNARDKAAAEHNEAVAHHELAKERLAKLMVSPTAEPAPKPEVPAEQIEAAPSPLAKLGNTQPPTVSPAHASTTIPQEPTPAPRPSYGRIALPEGQGTMGTRKLLTEGTPEGPKVPEGGLPKINLPEEKPAPKPVTDEASLRALEAKKGVVTENTPKKVHELLKESLKPAEKAPEYAGEERREVPRQAPKSAAEVEEAIKNRKPVQTPFDVTQGAMDTIKGDQNMPKHPAEQFPQEVLPPKEAPKGDRAFGKRIDAQRAEEERNTIEAAPKKEELVPVGEEGREPAKSAAEYHPAVQEQVFHLGNDNLDKLARAHGIDPAAPEYSRSKEMRNEGRHQTGRQKLAEDVTAQMSDDEKINIGRGAENLEHNPAMANKTKAERAASLFPRLRGPVDEAGNPSAGGGSQGADEEAENLKKETAKTSSKDTDHMQAAMKELGPDAKLSDITKRAQEMKDTHAQVAAHNENGGSTFHPTKGDLNGKPAFSVGGEPEFKSPDLKMTTDGKELTPDQLNEFAKRPAVKEALDKHKDASVGTWY